MARIIVLYNHCQVWSELKLSLKTLFHTAIIYILQISMEASNVSWFVRVIAGPPQELEFGPIGPINSSW